MLTLNGTTYRLCLLDTNAVSEVVKRPESLRRYLEWSHARSPALIPCFSMFTVVELRESHSTYCGFLDLFRRFPCLVLKSHDQLVDAEVAAYPQGEVNPALAGFAAPVTADLADVLDLAFADPTISANAQRWLDGRDEVVNSLVSLVENWLPRSGTSYTPTEIRGFLEVVGFQQLWFHDASFVEHQMAAASKVDIDVFPALKAMTFTVFYKFYADRTRKPSRSDMFDIIISSATPYVDAVITEAHQAEVLRKTQKLDPFLSHVEVMTLRDFRGETRAA